MVIRSKVIDFFRRDKQGILISNSGKEYVIDPRAFTKVGRGGSEDIIIVIEDDMKISRQNFAISFDEGTYYIEDLASRHGTYVNGHRITEDKIELKSGDIITIGSHTIFTFKLR